MEIDSEIFDSVIFLLLIQKGLLSVTSQMCAQSTGLLLSLGLPRKSLVWLTEHLKMTIAVDWVVKS